MATVQLVGWPDGAEGYLVLAGSRSKSGPVFGHAPTVSDFHWIWHLNMEQEVV